MRTRGLGGQRRAAVLAVVLAIAVAAPGLAAPAGAAPVRAAGRSELQSRPEARTAAYAKRRKVRRARLRPISAAKKKALLARYIKTHPGVVAAHARRPGVTIAKKLKAAANRRAHPAKKQKKQKAAPRKKAGRKPAAKQSAKHKKKKKGSAVSSWHRAAELLVGLSIGVLALFLIGSSVFSGPRSRARARARKRHRTLVTR